MATIKPCLGYETQTKAIEALHLKGFSPSDIACLCDCGKDNVYAALAALSRRNGNEVKEPTVSQPRKAMIINVGEPESEEDRRRRAIIRRAAEGARVQLRAIAAEGGHA